MLSTNGYAGSRVHLTNSETRQLFAKSSIVFVLHWRDDAQEYFVEHLKGYPRPENFLPPLVSWRRFAAEISIDPFAPTGDIPPRFVIVFMNAAPESELYITYRYTPNFIYKPEHIEVSEAISILREEKKKEEEKLSLTRQ